MSEEDIEDEFEWHQIRQTPEGYPVFACEERPGVERVAVPVGVWRDLIAPPSPDKARTMTPLDHARFRVATRLAQERAATYLIAGFLRGELDDSNAIRDALAEVEASSETATDKRAGARK